MNSHDGMSGTAKSERTCIVDPRRAHMRTAITSLLIAAMCLFAIALVSCGGDGDEPDASPAPTSAQGGEATSTPQQEAPDEPAGTVNSCDLITSDEAAAAVGGPVDEPERTFIGENFDQCVYRIQGGGDLDSAVIIQARPDTSSGDFDRLVEENAPSELGEVETIDGLGDKAVQQIATFVLEGDVMVVVTVLNDDADGGVALQQDIARTAITRLP